MLLYKLFWPPGVDDIFVAVERRCLPQQHRGFRPRRGVEHSSDVSPYIPALCICSISANPRQVAQNFVASVAHVQCTRCDWVLRLLRRFSAAVAGFNHSQSLLRSRGTSQVQSHPKHSNPDTFGNIFIFHIRHYTLPLQYCKLHTHVISYNSTI